MVHSLFPFDFFLPHPQFTCEKMGVRFSKTQYFPAFFSFYTSIASSLYPGAMMHAVARPQGVERAIKSAKEDI